MIEVAGARAGWAATLALSILKLRLHSWMGCNADVEHFEMVIEFACAGAGQVASLVLNNCNYVRSCCCWGWTGCGTGVEHFEIMI